VQVTVPPGTGPFEVGGLNLQLTVRTTVPGGCSTVSVALVNARLSIDSVQFEFAQSGAPAIVAGAEVVLTLNGVVPFLISVFGISWVPVNVIGAGFWPGEAFPPLFVHVDVTFPVAVSVILTSAFPSPDSSPEALRNRPPSVNDGFAFGPPLRWTLDATATDAVIPIAATTARTTSDVLRIPDLLSFWRYTKWHTHMARERHADALESGVGLLLTSFPVVSSTRDRLEAEAVRQPHFGLARNTSKWGSMVPPPAMLGAS
jgi:hypothetical protein